MSGRGHVVASEADPGATYRLRLHRPSGRTSTIKFADGSRASGATDVASDGTGVGTAGLEFSGAQGPVVPWLSHGGDAAVLPIPTTTGMPNYTAESVNAHDLVGGVATNYPNWPPNSVDSIADPIVWPQGTNKPVAPPIPAAIGQVYVRFAGGEPLIDVRNDGSASAVLMVPVTGAELLARWSSIDATPTLSVIPHGLDGEGISGRWVVGRLGQNMFVYSPTGAMIVDAAWPVLSVAVGSRGTYTFVTDGIAYDPSYIGRRLGTIHSETDPVTTADVEGGHHGMLTLVTGSGLALLSCSLGLPAANDVSVSPVALN
jgi:hypothetical protein